MPRRWLRIAHRGASGSAPEHTRPAFERALQLGVDMIELDVQLSRDGELVVVHDHELARTTNGRGVVREHDWSELRRLDAGSWFGPEFAGLPLLRLEEVMDLVGNGTRLNVEVKAPAVDWPALALKLARLLRAHDVLGSTVISCLETGALVTMREHCEEACIGLLWYQPDFADAWRWARTLQAVSIHPHWMLVSADVVRTAQTEGLQLLTWTVNDVDTMRTLVAQGVDGIMSDHPERFDEVGT